MPQMSEASPVNRLLRLLPPQDLQRVWSKLKRITLVPKQVLLEQDAKVGNAFFIESGTVSMLQTMDDGARIEVGLVGPEGFVGIPLLLGEETTAVEGMVQVEGEALQMPAAAFQRLLSELPAFAKLLLRYTGSFHVQVAQTAACNGRHQVEQRLARWLLMTHDRNPGDRFTMTQEFMSTLLGIRRPGVTVAIGALQRAGLVEHSRGAVTVVDRAGLEAASCECYQVVKRRFAWLDPVNAPKS